MRVHFFLQQKLSMRSNLISENLSLPIATGFVRTFPICIPIQPDLQAVSRRPSAFPSKNRPCLSVQHLPTVDDPFNCIAAIGLKPQATRRLLIAKTERDPKHHEQLSYGRRCYEMERGVQCLFAICLFWPRWLCTWIAIGPCPWHWRRHHRWSVNNLNPVLRCDAPIGPTHRLSRFHGVFRPSLG